MKRDKLYIILLTVLAAGYGWVLWNVHAIQAVHTPDVCLFHRVTGLPCPSCGTTRSVLSLYHLHPADAFYFNPLGFVVAVVLGIFPLWILYDLVSGRSSFYRFYRSAEAWLQRRWVAIPLILLIMTNWIWNIHKYTL